jgi:hypothetical protein
MTRNTAEIAIGVTPRTDPETALRIIDYYLTLTEPSRPRSRDILLDMRLRWMRRQAERGQRCVSSLSSLNPSDR